MKSLAFLVNDISAIGGSTKVTIMLANEMAKTRKVKIISLFKTEQSGRIFPQKQICMP